MKMCRNSGYGEVKEFLFKNGTEMAPVYVQTAWEVLDKITRFGSIYKPSSHNKKCSDLPLWFQRSIGTLPFFLIAIKILNICCETGLFFHVYLHLLLRTTRQIRIHPSLSRRRRAEGLWVLTGRYHPFLLSTMLYLLFVNWRLWFLCVQLWVSCRVNFLTTLTVHTCVPTSWSLWSSSGWDFKIE